MDYMDHLQNTHSVKSYGAASHGIKYYVKYTSDKLVRGKANNI